MSLGILTIECIEAKFTKSLDLIRKMDPYVVFNCREFEYKTETNKNGHKHPEWQGAKFDLDVKYLGDDLHFLCKDQDIGRDEKIGDGETKLSAFCCQEDWDEWFDVERKGKHIGKVHLKSHWAPVNAESGSHDEMGEIQQMIKDALTKKKELTETFNEVKDRMEAHEEENKAKMDGCEDGDKTAEWDQVAADADAKCAADHEAADAMKGDQDANKEAFEEEIANDTKLAAEIREATIDRIEKTESGAQEDKDAALAKADEDKAACEEQNKNNREEMEAKIAEIELKDRVREEAIKDEIKETAEKLLKINEQIAEHLQALTEL